MTDKEKLDKFVAEIERLKKIVDDPILSDNDLIIGERNTYMRLLSFYDSMQKEAKSEVKIKVEQIKAEVDAKECKDAQEPANDDLERFIYEHLWKGRMGEEITKPIYFGYDELLAVAQSIADWQKQQMMKDADNYIVDDDNTIKRFYDTGGVVGKPIIFGSTSDSINVGDHVKVIVIKEE